MPQADACGIFYAEKKSETIFICFSTESFPVPPAETRARTQVKRSIAE